MASHPNQTAVVAQAKADLLAAGVDLSGPCGAFRIVELAAWRIRAGGAGLLDKPSGNQCQGYATDIIAYADGQIYDVLIGSGVVNTPAWQDVGVVDPARWRPARDPHFDDPDPPPPEPPPPMTEVLLLRVLDRLGAVSDDIDTLAIKMAELRTTQQQGLGGRVFGYEVRLKP